MDLKQIERFVSVVDCGSLSLAARQLRLSQPALSKSIRLLEEELDANLLERGARGVRPTVEGRMFYGRARSMAAEYRRCRDELSAIKGGIVGRLAVGVAPGPGILNRVLPPAIQSVLHGRPGLGVRVVSGTILELLRALRREELDLILSVLDQATDEPDLAHEMLFDDRIVFAVRPGHPVCDRRRPGMQDLLKYRWALSQDAYGFWRSVEEHCALAGRAPLFSPIDSNSILFVKTAIGGSDYVGLLPAYAISEQERRTQFVVLDPKFEQSASPMLLKRPFGLIYRKDVRPVPAVLHLMRAIRENCRA